MAEKSEFVSIIADHVAHVRPRPSGKTDDQITAEFWAEWNAKKEAREEEAPVAADPAFAPPPAPVPTPPPPPDSPPPQGKRLEMRERPKGRGWYDVYDSDGNKVNPTPVRKTAAEQFVKEANDGQIQ